PIRFARPIALPTTLKHYLFQKSDRRSVVAARNGERFASNGSRACIHNGWTHSSSSANFERKIFGRMKFDAIIIGAGAAGLFCALHAGKRGRKVLVVEHNAQIGRKILISGGGRCNFTNLDVKPENFVSNNPHFAKSALARYTPPDFIELVKNHKI